LEAYSRALGDRDELFHTKHLVIQHYVGELYFLHFINGRMSHH
jgi:hypothetical protein